MRFLARFAMRGPFFAAATAAALQLGSLSVGILLILSGGIIALTTLRRGAREGLRVIAIAVSLAFAVRYALVHQGMPILILCMVTWLPSWIMAVVLGEQRQQAVPLLIAAVLVAGYAFAMRLVIGDVEEFWMLRLEIVLEVLVRETGRRFAPEQIAFIARNLHIWTLVAMNAMLVGMVMLGRWWQSVLFNPGGFGTEFGELRLPRLATMAAAIAGALFAADQALGFGLAIAGDVFVILVVLFTFQGLAVVHYRARLASMANGWLGGMYVLLLLLPQIVGPLLATAGVADSVANFRGLGRLPDGD